MTWVIAWLGYSWGFRSRPEAMVLSRNGLRLSTFQGPLVLPWPAVTRVATLKVLGQSQLAISIHPQAVPGQYGVEADPTVWKKFLKHGVRVGQLGLTPGLPQISAAVTHYSQGRVPTT